MGRIVASDFTAALVSVTLLDRDPETGARLDLKQVGADLEKIRAKHEDGRFSIHVIGFAKLISAVSDDWRDAEFRSRLVAEPDLATLRRIDDQRYRRVR